MPIYMRIEGITGTGKGPYAGWIEVESAQLGAHRSISNTAGQGVNREASAPSVSEIVVSKLADSASTALYRYMLGGEGKKVIIHFTKPGAAGAPYLAIEMENVMISSYSMSGSAGNPNGRPMESLSLNFTKITYSTTPTQSASNPKAVKDLSLWNLTVQKGP